MENLLSISFTGSPRLPEMAKPPLNLTCNDGDKFTKKNQVAHLFLPGSDSARILQKSMFLNDIFLDTVKQRQRYLPSFYISGRR